MKKQLFQSSSLYLLLFMVAFVWYSCSKKEETKPANTAPTGVTTSAVSSITQTSAGTGGNVGATGGADVTERGVCYDTAAAPTTAKSKTSDGTGIGSFTSALTGLKAGKTYFVRAYATNSVGTTYGNEQTFTTRPAAVAGAPILGNTTVASAIGNTSAKSGGFVTDQGNSAVLVRGVVWNTATSPEVSLATKTTDGDGTGAFTSTLTGLTANTKYYVRSYATNDQGTGYGTEITFTTGGGTPVNVTFNVNMSTTVIDAAGIHIAGSFQTPTWDYAATEMTAGANGVYSKTISVNPGTTIEYKFVNGNTIANAENFSGSCGVSATGRRTLDVGSTDLSVTFCYNTCEATCPVVKPTVTTAAVNTITLTGAKSGGNVLNEGGAPVTEKGVYWGDVANPEPSNGGIKIVGGTGIGSFISTITGLSANATYHVRAFATNSAGTSYGENLTFTTGTLQLPTITQGAISNITSSSATWTGNLTSNGGVTTGVKGVCWSTSPNPTVALPTKTADGDFNPGNFTAQLTGLEFNRTYYVRSYASNTAGTSYGNQLEFTTPSNLTIGQNFGGGKLAYLAQPGFGEGYVQGENHGLVVADADAGSFSWAAVSGSFNCISFSQNPVFPITINSYLEGENNTQTIINYANSQSCILNVGAARHCWDYVANGQSDWFLPSGTELLRIWPNRALIGGFGNERYWSSSNPVSDGSQVKYVDFSNGEIGGNSFQTFYKVRAVRKF